MFRGPKQLSSPVPGFPENPEGSGEIGPGCVVGYSIFKGLIVKFSNLSLSQLSCGSSQIG